MDKKQEKEMKQTQRGWHLRRVLVVLPWAAVFCGGGYAAVRYTVGYFTGEGAPLPDLLVFVLGLGTTALVGGAGASLFALGTRLYALLTWKGRLRKSLRPYVERYNQQHLPPEPVEDPLQAVLKEFSCTEKELPFILVGDDWILLPGQGMAREAIVGVYFDEYSWNPWAKTWQQALTFDELGIIIARVTRSAHARKARLTLVDDGGRRIVWEVPSKHALGSFLVLWFVAPWADTGDLSRLNRFLQKEGKNPDYKKLRAAVEPSALGISKWDHSAILEDNKNPCPYERWLMAAYALYIRGIANLAHYPEDPFSYVAGGACTARQRILAKTILVGQFEVENKDQLLLAAQGFLEEGRKNAGAWELSRGLMMLGFGYLAGCLDRKGVAEASLPLAQAVQEAFSGWEGFHDSYMEVYGKRFPEKLARRQQVYEELKSDPASVLNTVPFDMDLEERCQETLDAVQAMADPPREKENKG